MGSEPRADDSTSPKFRYDVFISHASEDKAGVALPLFERLTARELRVWLDKFELTLGDRLLEKIDQGLAESRYGVVILSEAFFRKRWPKDELNGLVSLEGNRGKTVLPVWHGVGTDEVSAWSPVLSGRIGVSTDSGLDHVADQIVIAVRGQETQQRFSETETDRVTKELDGIRRELVLAPHRDALKVLRYRVEAILGRSPERVDARLLLDSIVEAESRSRPVPLDATLSRQKPLETRPRRLVLMLWALFAVGLGVGFNNVRDNGESAPIDSPGPATAPTAGTGPLDPARDFERIVAGQVSDFHVDAALAKQRLRIGKDSLSMTIKSEKEGYLYVLLHSTDDTVVQLFPNQVNKKNRIRPGQSVTVPPRAGEGEAYIGMEAAGPAGTDTLLAIVSANPRDFSSAGMKASGPFLQTTRAAAAEAARRDPSGKPFFLGKPVCKEPCADEYGARVVTAEEVN